LLEKFSLEKNWCVNLKPIWDSDPNFKIYNPIELNNYPPNPCLTVNEIKEIMIYQGHAPCKLKINLCIYAFRVFEIYFINA